MVLLLFLLSFEKLNLMLCFPGLIFFEWPLFFDLGEGQ